jgi:hypothetical protein
MNLLEKYNKWYNPFTDDYVLPDLQRIFGVQKCGTFQKTSRRFERQIFSNGPTDIRSTDFEGSLALS